MISIIKTFSIEREYVNAEMNYLSSTMNDLQTTISNLSWSSSRSQSIKTTEILLQSSSIINIKTLQLKIEGKLFNVFSIQEREGFVVRAETDTFRAVGQGETEEEAISDITSAIKLLLEEEANPSVNNSWPEDFQ